MIPICLYSFWMVFLLIGFLSFFFLINFCFDFNFLMLRYSFGCDQLSYLIGLLSVWICLLMLLASSKIYFTNFYYKSFRMLILLLVFSLIFCFCSLNFLIFYIFFEVSLIPTLFLIVGWGYQPERLQAGVYLLFYTLFASLPMLVSLFFFYENNNTLIISFFINDLFSVLIFFSINMVFFVKIPLYLIHLWLPKAHVEAPVSGSIILAGVMLKLGGYGLIRLFPIFVGVGQIIRNFFIRISLVGGVIVSLICLRQRDIKSLIAYSSVAHIGLVVCGLFTFSYWGLVGSLLIIISHGLCSSGLFCLANISYERLIRRSLYLNKGLINLMPSMSLCWFLLCSSNIAAPPSLNLLSEILLLTCIVSWTRLRIFVLFFLSFFRACYSLFLYSYTQHGKIYSGIYSFFSCSLREYFLIFMHWIPLNLIFLMRDYFSLWV